MKKILLSTAIAGVVTSSILSAGVYAQMPQPAQDRPFYAGLIDRISSAFNLDKSKVQTVVDQWHVEKKTQMNQKMEDKMTARLNRAVAEGALTEAQKTALLNKLKEERAALGRDVLKNMSPEQRRAALDQRRSELEKWAQSQGIDPSFLRLGIKMGYGQGSSMGR